MTVHLCPCLITVHGRLPIIRFLRDMTNVLYQTCLHAVAKLFSKVLVTGLVLNSS